MATVAAIRDALKTRLATISGLRVYDTMPDTVQPPAAVIVPEFGIYDVTQGGSTIDYQFRIVLIAGRVSERSGQDKLDSLLSPAGASSIIAAVDADPDLGGVVDSSRVVRFEKYGTVDLGGVSYAAVEIIVEVFD